MEPERLAFTYDDPNDASNQDVEVATLTLTDLVGRTEVVYHQAWHLPEEQYPQVGEGVSGFFDRLAEHPARC